MHRELYCQIKYLFSFVKFSACVLLWSQVCLFFLLYSVRDRNLSSALSWQRLLSGFVCIFLATYEKVLLSLFSRKKILVFKISRLFLITKTLYEHKVNPWRKIALGRRETGISVDCSSRLCILQVHFFDCYSFIAIFETNLTVLRLHSTQAVDTFKYCH